MRLPSASALLILTFVVSIRSIDPDDEIEIADRKSCLPSLDDLACGMAQYKKLDKKFRIVGGREAVPGEFPYQVGIITSHRFDCGGSVIDERHVLTAAHCFVSSAQEDVAVEVGTHYKVDADHPSKNVSVEKIYIHDDFNTVNEGYDIAILRLAEPIEFKLTRDGFGSVNSICLPQGAAGRSNASVGDLMIASGFGLIEFKGESSDFLRTVQVNVIPTSLCKRLYKRDFRTRNYNSVICALTQGKDTCQGDSGGPLVREVNGRREQLGIVSWGLGCAAKGKPGVYTSVAYYKDWIKDKLDKSWKAIRKNKKKNKKKKQDKDASFWFFFDDFY